MADISKIKIPSGDEYNFKDTESRTDISGLSSSLETLQGRVTTLENDDHIPITNSEIGELVDAESGINLQAKTGITPTESSQTITYDTGYDGLSSVQINAIPSSYVGSGVNTQAAQTIIPGTSDQTIASGTYLTGIQTITGDANLIPANIVSGKSIFGVSGSASTGATNYVTGTFTTGSTTGSNETVTIPYTGSGYPIACMIFIEGGAYNSAVSGWYNSVQRYAVGQWTMSKSVQTSTPTYGTSGTANQGVTTAIYKNNASSSTSYTRTSAMNTNAFSSSNASNAALTCVRFKSSTTLSIYVASSSYGLLAGTTYRYHIIYSS